uniref:Uncharacterized protein n=1 Tax=Manihot esculenta TaxID=3983 RepID=A0A251JCR9_MANES
MTERVAIHRCILKNFLSHVLGLFRVWSSGLDLFSLFFLGLKDLALFFFMYSLWI